MSGYIVNNTGDTIRGQIDNQKWATSPLKITFKNNPFNSEVIEYKPTKSREVHYCINVSSNQSKNFSLLMKKL